MQLTLVCVFGVAACVFGQVGANVNQPLAPLDASNNDVHLRGPLAQVDPVAAGASLMGPNLVVLAGVEINANILLKAICSCKDGSQADLITMLRTALGLVVDISVDLTTQIRATITAVVNVVVTVKDLIKAKFGVIADLNAFVTGVLGLTVGIGVDLNQLCAVPVVVKDGVSTCEPGTESTSPSTQPTTASTQPPTPSTQPTCGCA